MKKPDDRDANARSISRGLLPEVMLAEDIALVRGISIASARRSIRCGECGAWSKLGRRLVVRREEFLQALRNRETTPIFNQGATPSSDRPHDTNHTGPLTGGCGG